MNRVFIWISGSMILGILSSYYFNFNTNIIFLLFVIICLYSFYNIMREKLNNIQIIIIFLFLGILLETFYSKNILLNYVGSNQEYSGIIEDIVGDSTNKKKYIVLVDKVDNREISKEKTLISILGKDILEIGWRVDFSAKLNLPSRNTNPKLFNYREYLLSKGIHTIGSVKDYNIKSIERTSSPKYTFKKNIKNRVDTLYDKYLNTKNSSIIKSMLLGDSTYLEEGDLKNYRDLGLAHILAISGLHIGIISGFLLFLLSNLAIKRRINISITLMFIWIYGFIVGFPPSILRANTMLSILLYSQMFHEPYDIINSLFFVMFILLVFNPYSILSIGFILSFVATFSIIILTPKIKDVFYPYESKLVDTVSSILGVQIGLYPVLAYYFNSIPILGIFGNLFIIPILSLAIIFGFSMFFIEPVFSSLNLILGPLLNSLLDFQFTLVDILSSFYFKDIKMASPNIFLILLYYLFLLLLFKIIKIDRLDKKLVNSICIYILIFIIISFVTIEIDEKVELHFMDVGQGDSILIRNSHYDYLIDTGGSLFGDFDIGENITLPYLEKIGVKRLKAVFITHFHEDHYQGLYALLGKLKIDQVISAYRPEGNNILSTIDRENVPFLLLKSRDRVNLGKGLNLDVIWSGEKKSKNENNMSLVTILNYKDHRILFTGDMEAEVEGEIIDSLGEDIDIIKVPHHGSNTSSTRRLLEKTRPNIGIISVGRNNMYNHPSQDVLNRYKEINTDIYRTDELGMVKITLRKGNIQRECFLVKEMDIELYLLYYCIYFMLSYILTRIYYELERGNNFEL